MPKIYTVEIQAYPQEFKVYAESAEEAKMIASERWYQRPGATSIYESTVTDVEDNER